MIPPDQYEESFVSVLDDDESVELFPTFGRWDPERRAWVATLHGWIHRPLSDGSRRDRLLKRLRKSLGIKKKAATDNFERRARPFLADCLGQRVLRVQLGEARYTLPPSADNGHFHNEILIPAAADEEPQRPRRVDYRLILADTGERAFHGEIELLPERGLSVVSDIDDTIKLSEVASKKRLLANTFLHPYREVEGMAELLRGWAGRGASLHYVSSTPWQLYPALSEFFDERAFPPGSLHLKSFRWRDRSFFDLFASPKRTKRKALEPLFAAFPGRRFLLIGDSVEKDPEIYARLAEAHPEQVAGILIRDVAGEGAEASRFRKAFKQLPPERWRLFREAGEAGELAEWLSPPDPAPSPPPAGGTG